jgi:hypothetical protein
MHTRQLADSLESRAYKKLWRSDFVVKGILPHPPAFEAIRNRHVRRSRFIVEIDEQFAQDHHGDCQDVMILRPLAHTCAMQREARISFHNDNLGEEIGKNASG